MDELLHHVDWLRALARSLVDDRDLAEDAAQDACVAVLERPPADSGWPRAWLGTVLRRAIARRLRREAQRASVEERAQRQTEASEPSRVAEELALHRQIVDEVDGLDEPYRTAIVLRFYRGLTPREIAKQLGLPPGTVRSRLHRGLVAIRRGLDGRHDGRRERWSLALMTTLTLAPLEVARVPQVLSGAVVMTKKSALVAAAVLCIVAGWAIVEFVGDESSQSLPEAIAAQDERGEVGARRRADAPKEDGATLPDRAEAAEPLPSTDVASRERGFKVHCRSDDGQPVAGALVAVADPDEIARLRSLADIAQWQGRRGAPSETDANGEVGVDGDKRSAHIIAIGPDGAIGVWNRGEALEQLTGRFKRERNLPLGFDARNRGAAALLEDARCPVEIRLSAQQLVVLQTMASDGTPRGDVPLRWRVHDETAGPEENWNRCRSDAVTRIAALRIPGEEAPREIEVEARVLARETPRITLAANPRPGAPHAFRLPPLGQLEVRVVDQSGEALPFVNLRATSDDDATSLWRSEQSLAQFKHVEVGLTLKLEAWTLGGRCTDVVAGPAAINATVEHELRAPSGGLILKGRVLDDEKRPLANERILLTGSRPSSEGHEFEARWCRLRTDADGRFRTDIGVFGERPPAGACLTITGIADQELSQRPIDELSGEARIPAPSADGIVDLGDIALHPLPILVAGRVVDEHGVGLAGAVVEATPEIKDAGVDLPVMISRERGRRTTNFGPGTLQINPQGWRATGPVNYEVVRVGQARVTDADGRFVVRWSGLRELKPQVRIEAFMGGYVQVDPVLVNDGDGDATVRLRQGFLVSGRLVGLREPEAVQVDLVIDEDAGHCFELELGRDGSFATERSLGTSAAIRVRVRDSQAELCRLAVTPPSAGVERVDLGSVDLTPLLTQVLLDVVDEDGVAIEGLRVQGRERASERWRPLTARNRQLIISYKTGFGLTLRISAPGFLPREIVAETVDSTLTLTRAVPLVVAITNLELVPSSHTLEASLHHIVRPGNHRSVGAKQSIDSFETKLSTIGPGRYRVALSLRKNEGRRRSATVRSPGPSAEILIEADSQAPRLTIALDGDALRAAIDRLR